MATTSVRSAMVCQQHLSIIILPMLLFSKEHHWLHSPSNGEDDVEMMQNEAFGVHPRTEANVKMVQIETYRVLHVRTEDGSECSILSTSKML